MIYSAQHFGTQKNLSFKEREEMPRPSSDWNQDVQM